LRPSIAKSNDLAQASLFHRQFKCCVSNWATFDSFRIWYQSANWHFKNLWCNCDN